MSFSRTKLANEIADKLANGEATGLAKQIAAYLIDSGKTGQLNSLVRDVMQMQKSKNNVLELTAISAHELGQEQIDDIESLVKNTSPGSGKVIINRQIDPSIIGGVRLEFANHLLDLSASAKLSRLKQLTSN